MLNLRAPHSNFLLGMCMDVHTPILFHLQSLPLLFISRRLWPGFPPLLNCSSLKFNKHFLKSFLLLCVFWCFNFSHYDFVFWELSLFKAERKLLDMSAFQSGSANATGVSLMIFKIHLGFFFFFVLRKLPVIFRNSKVMVWMEECTCVQNLASFAYSLCWTPLGYKGMVSSWWPPSPSVSILHVRTPNLSEIGHSGVQMALLIERAACSLSQAPKTHTSLHNLMFLQRSCPVFGHSRYFGLLTRLQYPWGHPISFHV